MDAGKLMAPKVIPKEVKIIKEDAEPDMSTGMSGGVPGGVAGGSMGGVLGGVIGGMGGAPAPPKPKLTGPLRVGGNVQAARIINRVQPVYPPLARQTRISGTVRLHAIIGKDGTDSTTRSSERPSLAAAVRAGCCPAVALSADSFSMAILSKSTPPLT